MDSFASGRVNVVTRPPAFLPSGSGFRSSLVLAFVWGLLVLATPARADLRVTAYYPGYRQSYLRPSNIDFSAVTHIIHFSVMPNADGTLNTGANGLTPAYSTNLVTRAHAAGRKALICVGGAGSQAGFQGATTPANLAAFVSNLTNFMATYDYDGVDLDWEPLDASDTAQFTNLVNALRAGSQWFRPAPITDRGHRLAAGFVRHPPRPVRPNQPHDLRPGRPLARLGDVVQLPDLRRRLSFSQHRRPDSLHRRHGQ